MAWTPRNPEGFIAVWGFGGCFKADSAEARRAQGAIRARGPPALSPSLGNINPLPRDAVCRRQGEQARVIYLGPGAEGSLGP